MRRSEATGLIVTAVAMLSASVALAAPPRIRGHFAGVKHHASRWTAIRVAPRQMLALACPSARQCTGVGDSGLTVTFDPANPSRRRAGTIDPLHTLFGIACTSAKQCTVSANPGRELTIVPGSLHVQSSRLVLGGSDFSTVACATRHRCVAVAGSREVTFDPHAPARRTAALLPMGNVARVACPSPTECVAVDYNGRELTFDPRSPRSTGPPVTLDPQGLSGVTCPSSRQCTAIGQTSGNAITFDPSAPASATSTPVDPNSDNLLDDISCPSTRQCTLIDGNGLEITFNPLTPGHPAPVNLHITADMLAIACPTITQCTVIAGRRELTFNPHRTR